MVSSARETPEGVRIRSVEVILYVADQARSARFYREVLGREPVLDVPGMTEFALGGGTKLGLMPDDGIAALLGPRLPHPSDGTGIPRCELYLVVADARAAHARAVAAGALAVSEVAARSWGDEAGYVADPDGHVVAFAQEPPTVPIPG